MATDDADYAARPLGPLPNRMEPHMYAYGEDAGLGYQESECRGADGSCPKTVPNRQVTVCEVNFRF